MILSVRYRNHFAVVQFQNQAHIWNPYDSAEVFKTMGSAGARNMGRRRQPKYSNLGVSLAYAAFGGDKKKLGCLWCPVQGAMQHPKWFKYLTRSMRIPNMCLVLKLDNGKVVSIANGLSDRTIQYRISI